MPLKCSAQCSCWGLLHSLRSTNVRNTILVPGIPGAQEKWYIGLSIRRRCHGWRQSSTAWPSSSACTVMSRPVEWEGGKEREDSFFVHDIRITLIFSVLPVHAPAASVPCLGTHWHARGSMCLVFSEEHCLHSPHPGGRTHSCSQYKQMKKIIYHYTSVGQRNRCAFCTGKRGSPLHVVPKDL